MTDSEYDNMERALVSLANGLHAAASAPRTTAPSAFTQTLAALMRHVKDAVPQGCGLDDVAVPVSAVAGLEAGMGQDPSAVVARWAAEDEAMRRQMDMADRRLDALL